ncbi:chromatin modification- protein VID21 [Chytridiales sp. JEL 0842]|nr:chromatin modification- protein VID21 [Chytridiales sp. JEL 0842]
MEELTRLKIDAIQVLRSEMSIIIKERESLIQELSRNQREQTETLRERFKLPEIPQDLVRQLAILSSNLLKSGQPNGSPSKHKQAQDNGGRTLEPPLKKRRILYPYDGMTYQGPERIDPTEAKSAYLQNRIIRQERDRDILGYQLQSWQMKVQIQPVSKLLSSAQKIVFTKDWLLAREEAKQLKAIRKIEALKEDSLWSSKQLERQVIPSAGYGHWDNLLTEMKWMREDFRQERKLRLAVAYTMANWVMDWHRSADKQSLCVKSRPVEQRPVNKSLQAAQTELVDDVSPMEIDDRDQSVEPRVLSATSTEPATFPQQSMRNSNVAEAEGLQVDLESMIIWPLKNVVDEVQDLPLYKSRIDSQSSWSQKSKNLVPISKILAEKAIMVNAPPPREEPAESKVNIPNLKKIVDAKCIFSASPSGEVESAALESTTESVKPPIKPEPVDFVAKQNWTNDEDETLLCCVQDFSANWQLVAETLASHRLGNGEKRSEWDCYHRYIDLSKTRTQSGDASLLSGQNVQQPSKQEAMKRMSKKLSVFDYILRKQKSRPERPNRNSQQFPKKVNLVAHETHRQSQESVGINPNAEPLGPLEVSILKREREMLLQQQQNSRVFAHPRVMQNMMQARPNMPNIANGAQLAANQALNQLRPVGRPPNVGNNSSPLVIQGLHAGNQNMVRPGGQQMGNQMSGVPLGTPRLPNAASALTPEQVQQLLLRRAANLQYPMQMPTDPNVLAQISAMQQLSPALRAQLNAAQVSRQAQLQQQQRSGFPQGDLQQAAAFLAMQNSQNQKIGQVPMQAADLERQRQQLLLFQQQQQGLLSQNVMNALGQQAQASAKMAQNLGGAAPVPAKSAVAPATTAEPAVKEKEAEGSEEKQKERVTTGTGSRAGRKKK